ncbi:MAG: ribonuclease HII [Candidatus Hydrothermales bacterium]
MENVYKFLEKAEINAKRPVGVDEVGRGSIAGPIVACALYIPKGVNISFVKDSKLLTPENREKILERLLEKNIKFGIAFVFPEEIDSLGIQEANYTVIKRAIKNLSIKPDLVLVDGFKVKNLKIRQLPIVKGDRKIDVIAGASIIAKVTRDRWMEAISNMYPEYRFDINKGYYSDFHIEMIKKNGISPLHRKTFEPIKSLLKGGQIL